MRLSLWNEPQIGAIPNGGGALVQTLKQLTASIRAGWNAQHDGDGKHTDVTAASLTTPTLRSRGRVVYGRIWDVNQPAAANTAPMMPGPVLGRVGLDPIGGLIGTEGADAVTFNVVRIRTNSTVGATVVHGIAGTTREQGERLLIVNVGNFDLTLRMSYNSNAAKNSGRFTINSNLVPAVFGELTIGSGGIIEATWLFNNFLQENLWHLPAVREA